MSATDPDTDRILERAAQWGIETQHYDGLGRHRLVAPQVLSRILDVMARAGAPSPPPLDAALPVVPQRAYQGAPDAPRRTWALAVQLYGVRSRRNWGHGDFTDLAGLIDLASGLGAAGVGLNPLHALFDDRAEEASPYFPSSRFFLNPLNIDVEAIPEFPGSPHGLAREVAAPRAPEFVDYAAVAQAEAARVGAAYDAFRQTRMRNGTTSLPSPARTRGVAAQYAAFEVLPPVHGALAPAQALAPDEGLAAAAQHEAETIARGEFVRWIATNGSRPVARARSAGLPIGFISISRSGSAPTGSTPERSGFILPAIRVRAPPDLLNTQGQRWGSPASTRLSCAIATASRCAAPRPRCLMPGRSARSCWA